MFKNNLAGGFQNPSIDVTSTTGARLSNFVRFNQDDTLITPTGTSPGTPLVSSDGNIKSDYSQNEIFALRPGDISIDFDAVGWLDGTKSVGDLAVGGAILDGAGGSAPTGKSTAHIQNVSIDVPIGRSPLNKLGNHYAFARKTDFPVNMTLSASALMTDFSDGSLDGLICGGEQREISLLL